MRFVVGLSLVTALLGCGGGSSSDGDARGSGSDGTVGPPAASSWLGTNLGGDLPWNDITHQLSPFDTQDASGYPPAGQSGTSQTDIGFVLPSGMYNISYEGTGTLAVSGIGTLVGNTWTMVGAEHRGVLQITGTPGEFGHFLNLAITNTGSQTVTAIHIYMPGIDYDTPGLFRAPLLGLIAPFRALRFMDWEATNGSTLADFADRAQPNAFGQSPHGVPYEHIVDLINESGKDAWITVPEHATDDFVHQLAALFAARLDFTAIASARAAQGIGTPFELIVEYSNETWNGGFSAYQTLLDAANANPQRYTGVYDGTYGPSFMTSNTDLMKVGQYEADRLVTIGDIFKQELGANASVVKPVLSGWALGAAYSDVGLRFIQANYGAPKDHVAYVALAPYFGADESQTGALGTLFDSANADIQSKHAALASFAQLGTDYSIAIAAYEGGQSLTGTTNQTIKHLAQHDLRMYDTYTSYLLLWNQVFHGALFCHFTLAGTAGLPENIYQYGYWGSMISIDEDLATCGPSLMSFTGTEPIASVVHHCPKYRALVEAGLAP